MSQTSEELSLRSFFVRCLDVGLNCDCVIFGKSEEKVMHTMVTYMYEYHAINPEEMTSCMKMKIRENVRESRAFVVTFLRAQYKIPKVF